MIISCNELSYELEYGLNFYTKFIGEKLDLARKNKEEQERTVMCLLCK